MNPAKVVVFILSAASKTPDSVDSQMFSIATFKGGAKLFPEKSVLPRQELGNVATIYYGGTRMRLAEIHLDRIRSPRCLLRPVRTESVEYNELLDSIRDKGVLQPILVRFIGPAEYEVVEGNWRYHCCKQLRMETIPCQIQEMTDDEMLVIQLQANGIRPETRPVEFAVRLERILHNNPGMTVPQLSRLIRKSPSWVRQILDLNDLRPAYKEMLRRGEIPLQSACLLAKTPYCLQDAYIESAVTLTCAEFKTMFHQVMREYREAAQRKFIDEHNINRPDPIPYLRKFTQICSEYKNPQVQGLILRLRKAETPSDGWMACLEWILHLDPKSLVRQEEMFKARLQQREHEMERRKLERQQLRELREIGGNLNLETE